MVESNYVSDKYFMKNLTKNVNKLNLNILVVINSDEETQRIFVQRLPSIIFKSILSFPSFAMVLGTTSRGRTPDIPTTKI